VPPFPRARFRPLKTRNRQIPKYELTVNYFTSKILPLGRVKVLVDFFGLFAGTMCLVVVFLPLIIRILIIVWMVKDGKKRGKGIAVPLILGLFLGVIGLIIWLVIRPDVTEYPMAQQPPMAPPPQAPPPQEPPPQY
jgi:hypothetical protein